MLKKHVFGSFNLNNSEKHRLSSEDIFLGTRDTYTKKMNPPSAVLGGGVHGKVCWLMAYMLMFADDTTLYCNVNNDVTDDLLNYEQPKICDWLGANKLALNLSKTKFMVFHSINRHVI